MDHVPVIRILRGWTHSEVGLMPQSPVASAVGDYIRQNLSEYNVRAIYKNKMWVRNEYTLVARYISYDNCTNILRIPVGFTGVIKEVIESRGGRVEEGRLRDYPLREIDMEVLPDFHDQEHQIELIKICSSDKPGMKGLAMQTGKGKTYSAIRAICNLGYAAAVIVPGLTDQWIDSFAKFTGKRDEVYKIQEIKSLEMLMSSTWKPSVFVCSVQTMQAYCKGKENYKALPLTYREFFEHYGIGVKVVDEAHLNFHATNQMDLQTNVPYNLYCTATFSQTNKFARKIFNVVYPPEIRYGEEKYDKYVDVFFYNFIGEVQESKCIRQRGYSHIRYEEQLLKSHNRFENHVDTMICPLINMHFRPRYQPGRKCLIFCSGIEFIKALVRALSTRYPEYKVMEYIGESSVDTLEKADILVATVGKAGTGLDVKGLITAINTVSIRASIITKQMLGRLRRIEGEKLVYVDRCDTNLSSHVRHAECRKLELRNMAWSYHEFNGYHDTVGVHFINGQVASSNFLRT